MDLDFFRGCIPALMTPCRADRTPHYEALVAKAEQLMQAGMSAVVYCGSMGDWPLLSDQQRQTGVQRLVRAGVPVVVGTGAQNSAAAVAHAAHAAEIGARGLMIIPRLMSRATSTAAQRDHFARVLAAAPGLPAVIYNSPYYGFETKAELFFDLRKEFPNLVGFKEFGGAASLSYAGEHITHADPDVLLLAGVDTQVYHGYVHCGAVGTITGIGNCLPQQALRLVDLCKAAAKGDPAARQQARELTEALAVLASFDEGPDLVLYYKHLLVLLGEPDYQWHFNDSDRLSASQQAYAEQQLKLFLDWWQRWPHHAQPGGTGSTAVDGGVNQRQAQSANVS